MTRASHNFTIVELLVVIGIIAILASMLLPALAAARAKGRMARWTGFSSNVRTDGQLMAYYNFANDGSSSQVSNVSVGAGLDPYDTSLMNGQLENAAQWSYGRWRGKNAIFNVAGNNGYASMGGNRNNRTFSVVEDKLTLIAWVRQQSWTSAWQAIVTKGDSAWRLHRYGNSNTLAFGMNGPSGGPDVAASTDVTDGRWHMVAGTYDGTTAKIYVDGKLEGTMSRSGNVNQNNYEVRLLSNAQRASREWGGWVDEVAIYNRTLSDQEITDWYNMGTP